MKKLNSYEDFAQMSERNQRRYLERQIKDTPAANGVVFADIAMDVLILFKRDDFGKLRIIRTEKLSDVIEQNELSLLAKKATQNKN